MQTSVSWVVGIRLLSLYLVLHETAAAAAAGSQPIADSVTEFRIRSQNLHVDYIGNELDKLESELKKWTEPSVKEVALVKARVQRLEKHQCLPNELECGGEFPQCVSHLLVCDGIKDCKSGHDECQDTCGGHLVKAGSAFTGVSHSDTGILLYTRPLALVIQSVQRSPVFPSLAVVKGIFTAEYEGQVYSTPYDGHFVYATRQLEIRFTDFLTYHFILDCVFPQADDDHLHCSSYMEASKTRYSTFKLARA